LIQLWPAVAGENAITIEKSPAAGLPVSGGRNGAVLLSWCPDSKILAFATPQRTTIRLWDMTARGLLPQLEGHKKPLRSLAWCADGKRIATAADDGTVKVWDVPRGCETSSFTYYVKQVPSRDFQSPRASSILSWCPDGKRLAVMGEDDTVTVRDVDTGESIPPLHGHPSNLDLHEVRRAVAWSPDGKRLAATSPDGTFLVWDTTTWQEVLTLREHSDGALKGPPPPGSGGRLAWSPDGWSLAFFGGDGRVTIWDATPDDKH
jgi:WD40 repeat protein